MNVQFVQVLLPADWVKVMAKDEAHLLSEDELALLIETCTSVGVELVDFISADLTKQVLVDEPTYLGFMHECTFLERSPLRLEAPRLAKEFDAEYEPEKVQTELVALCDFDAVSAN